MTCCAGIKVAEGRVAPPGDWPDRPYDKPLLDRALRPGTPMPMALELAYLSFDSSRFGAANVGFPIDFMTYHRLERQWRLTRFDDARRPPDRPAAARPRARRSARTLRFSGRFAIARAPTPLRHLIESSCN